MWSTYILLVASLACANAFSEGAPEDACSDMTPHHHGLRAQKSEAPYTISTNLEAVKGGKPVVVVIRGKTPANKFRGLLLQTRQNGKIINGKFQVAPNDPFFQLLDCGQPGNAVTHKSHSDAENKQEHSVTWIPPPNFNGEVKFRATIVQDFENFWKGVLSEPLKVSA